MSDTRTIFVCPDCDRWRGHSGPGPVLSRGVASLYCVNEGHRPVVSVEVVPTGSSTLPDDEWLKGEEVTTALIKVFGAKAGSYAMARQAQDALLEALAEQRKEGQHGC